MSCKHVDAAGKLIQPFLVLRRVIYFEGQALGKCRATIVLNAGAKTEGYDLFFIPPSPIFSSSKATWSFQISAISRTQAKLAFRAAPSRTKSGSLPRGLHTVFRLHSKSLTFDGFPMLHYTYGAS